MNTNLQGNIGESIALKHFISEGYEVYLPFGTASKYDMIVVKDNIPQRVSVKTTTRKTKSGKWLVKIEQGKLKKMAPFDKVNIDLLFIYIVLENRHVILDTKDIKTTKCLTI